MRRGFKSWCERASAEYRSHLGLDFGDALDPHDLARYLGVLVCAPHDIPGLSCRSIDQLTRVDPSSWSAVTVAAGGRNLVILNSAHSLNRQRSSLAHELAHIVLGHRPATTSVSHTGFLFRDRYDAEQEEEADWLAGALLLPRDGLLSLFRRTSSSQVIGRIFGVSTKLVDWRLRMTGILVQARRAGQRRRRAD